MHNPDGLAPDGGHPRLSRETLSATNNISHLTPVTPPLEGHGEARRPP